MAKKYYCAAFIYNKDEKPDYIKKENIPDNIDEIVRLGIYTTEEKQLEAFAITPCNNAFMYEADSLDDAIEQGKCLFDKFIKNKSS